MICIVLLDDKNKAELWKQLIQHEYYIIVFQLICFDENNKISNH